MTTNQTSFARKLRCTPNPAEQALWSVLKARQLGGYKFTQQCAIGPYFADFACRSEMLVIELDGSQHHDKLTYDGARDAYMQRCGYSVLRFPSASALNGLVIVCDAILAALEGRIENYVEAPDMRFSSGKQAATRRGLNSRSAVKQRRT